MNFQTIILKLQKFWADQNCIMGQPYDVEKGAGTMNPSTFLLRFRTGTMACGLCRAISTSG